jgi:hypothetical protein
LILRPAIRSGAALQGAAFGFFRLWKGLGSAEAQGSIRRRFVPAAILLRQDIPSSGLTQRQQRNDPLRNY